MIDMTKGQKVLVVIGMLVTAVWTVDKYYAKAAELDKLEFIVAANEINSAFRDKSREVASLKLLLEGDANNAALRLQLQAAETDLAILRAQLLNNIKKGN